MRLFVNNLGGNTALNYVDVVVIAGQSNARGNTNSVAPSAPYITPNANAKILGYNGDGITNITAFEVMDYTQGNFLGDLHAAEASLAYGYGTSEMYIVKVVKGATSLAVDWASGSTYRNQLLTSIGLAKTHFSTNGINVKWHFYWNQWESDVNDATRTANYEDNYKSFITDVESSAAISFESQILHKVNPNASFYTSNATNGAILVTVQTSLETFYDNLSILDADDLAFHDGGHYTSASQITIGERLYNLIP